MKRIDLLGAPYAGKTTVYKELLLQRARGAWLNPEEALLLAARREARTSLTSPKMLARFLGSYIPSPWTSKILKKATVLAGSPMQWEKREGLEPFLSACIRGLESIKEYPLRYLFAAGKVMNYLRETLIIQDAAIPAVVVSEGSVANQAWNIMFLDERGSDTVRTYYETMPAPTGLVYLKATPEQLWKRVQNGGRGVHLWHRDMDEGQVRRRIASAVQICEIGVKVLARRGVRVLEVDATLSPQGIAKRITTFAGSLEV